MPFKIIALALSCCALISAVSTSYAQKASVDINVDIPEKPISPDLFGIFFEDINYSADGGLYAELIQNRSFEYQPLEQSTWTPFSFWELVKRGQGEGNWALEAAGPIHPNNPHYLVLEVAKAGDGVGISNNGFDGIPVKAGETYDFSFFTHQLYMNRRWGPGSSIDGKRMPVLVRLEGQDGATLAEASFSVVGRKWQRLSGALIPNKSDESARLVLLATEAGGIALDEISLFPRKTFRNRPNGLRSDLAQVVADIHPKFIRFPGGCLAHGNGTNNFYRWKDTIGPIQERRGQPNLWGYHQSAGLGYFEYFQYCEDIGAKPLPILPAAVSCQNSDHTSGVGQQCLPIADMPMYIQDVMDLVEWANGPATSKWGSKRAAAGHPEPFHLEYIGIGNEDAITPEFEERFKMIFEALKAKHPEITVVGTVGPAPSGPDFDAGWSFANKLHIPIVDEHYYQSPDWFLENFNRYDTYDRSRSKVYVGEYAAHESTTHGARKSTLRTALAEAAYMTQLERNGDVVVMSSYAPLLARVGHTQWTPDLIYFDGSKIFPTINYFVQQLFASNAGNMYLNTRLEKAAAADKIAVSSVRDTKTGDVIIKLVNNDSSGHPAAVRLNNIQVVESATKTVLSGDPLAVNEPDDSPKLLPKTVTISVAQNFDCELQANSLTVIRIKTLKSR